MAAATAPSPAVVALRLRHGAPLYHEGMPLTCLFIVCEGLVAQSFSRQHAHTFYIHGKGSCPDLIDTLSGISVHRTSAFAMGDTVVASIPREELRMDTDSLTPNATSLLKQIVRQAKGLEDHFLQGPSDRSYDRVVNLFHQLLYASGQINASDTILPLPIDRPLYSKLTGVVPATFSRMMTRLRHEQLVIPTEQGFHIPDPARLCRIATIGKDT